MKHDHAATTSNTGTTVPCPVCRMDIDPGAAPAAVEHEGETYSFCNLRCRDRFQARPESFLARGRGPRLRPVTLG